jgi:hypothetical protein
MRECCIRGNQPENSKKEQLVMTETEILHKIIQSMPVWGMFTIEETVSV